MKLTLVNIYPRDTVARYMLSGYVLKAYLGKYYEGHDLDVEVLNFIETVPVEDLYKKLTAAKADLIGYSCYIWNVEKILDVVRRIKDTAGGIIHILGGPEISVKRISSLEDPSIVDYYVIGEGEKQLLNLIYYIRSAKNRAGAELPRGVVRWENGSLKYSKEGAENIKNLDEIPSIYLDKVIEDNLYEKQQVFLETQRGCIYKCKYCVYHKLAPSIRFYSRQRVRQELDYLIIDKHVTAIRVIDPIFTSDLKRAKEIARHLAELKEGRVARLPWIYWEFDYTSPDEEFIKLTASLKYREKILNTAELPSLDRPQLYSDMLKDYTVINSVGVESFCEQALKAVGRKGINLQKFDEFMKRVNTYNIVLKLDLILGLPFETIKTYFEGLETLLPYFRNTDHVINIHRLQILPGSELESLTDENKIVYSRRAPHMVFSTNTLSEDELGLASKLSAVLSRIVNSPLRGLFFEVWERSGGKLENLINKIYTEICASQELAATPLVQAAAVDDIYWNDQIYRDIRSKLIEDVLRK